MDPHSFLFFLCFCYQLKKYIFIFGNLIIAEITGYHPTFPLQGDACHGVSPTCDISRGPESSEVDAGGHKVLALHLLPFKGEFESYL